MESLKEVARFVQYCSVVNFLRESVCLSKTIFLHSVQLIFIVFSDGSCESDAYRDGDYPHSPESAWMGDNMHDPGHMGGPYE